MELLVPFIIVVAIVALIVWLIRAMGSLLSRCFRPIVEKINTALEKREELAAQKKIDLERQLTQQRTHAQQLEKMSLILKVLPEKTFRIESLESDRCLIRYKKTFWIFNNRTRKIEEQHGQKKYVRSLLFLKKGILLALSLKVLPGKIIVKNGKILLCAYHLDHCVYKEHFWVSTSKYHLFLNRLKQNSRLASHTSLAGLSLETCKEYFNDQITFIELTRIGMLESLAEKIIPRRTKELVDIHNEAKETIQIEQIKIEYPVAPMKAINECIENLLRFFENTAEPLSRIGEKKICMLIFHYFGRMYNNSHDYKNILYLFLCVPNPHKNSALIKIFTACFSMYFLNETVYLVLIKNKSYCPFQEFLDLFNRIKDNFHLLTNDQIDFFNKFEEKIFRVPSILTEKNTAPKILDNFSYFFKPNPEQQIQPFSTQDDEIADYCIIPIW